ncbi:MAG TPA: ABC transporter substrate-binding protein [Trebonia sp.]|nr:ABC transporter substrate-binding protein [Trebonia sp.]
MLAACSSGSSSSAGSGHATPTGSGSLTSLTVAYAAPGAGFSDLYVGIADGIFKKYGLNVKIVQVTPANLVPALLSGSVQIGGGVADGAASAILSGEGLEYIALTEGTYNLQLWVNEGITSVHDLVGKTVALTTQGSENDFALTALLQSDGIDPSSVNRRYLVTVPEELSAMRSGAAVAALFQPPNAQPLTKTGGRILASLTSLPFAVGAYLATSSYVAANASAIAKFYAAEQANLAFLRSSPQQTLAAIKQYNPASTTSGDKIAYDFFLNVWKKDPTVEVPLIQAAFDRAAAKVHKTAPSRVTQYIYSPPGAG